MDPGPVQSPDFRVRGLVSIPVPECSFKKRTWLRRLKLSVAGGEKCSGGNLKVLGRHVRVFLYVSHTVRMPSQIVGYLSRSVEERSVG